MLSPENAHPQLLYGPVMQNTMTKHLLSSNIVVLFEELSNHPLGSPGTELQGHVSVVLN